LDELHVNRLNSQDIDKLQNFIKCIKEMASKRYVGRNETFVNCAIYKYTLTYLLTYLPTRNDNSIKRLIMISR